MRIELLLGGLACALLSCRAAHVQEASDGESDFRAFIAKWERAQTRFINGDPTQWKQNASHGDDVTIFGAFGGSEKGWQTVGPRNDWASGQFTESGATQSIEYLSTGVSGDLAFTVAIERQVARIEGQVTSTPRSLRVTQVFRREGREWRLLHRHADPLVERLPPGARR
jgi:hypothetical protein